MVRQIPLSNAPGVFALVDDSDYDLVKDLRWSRRVSKNTSYAYRSFSQGGKTVTECLHVMLMRLPKGKCVDHINRNGLDCRRSNLRESTYSQNRANATMRRHASGYQGVAQVSGSTFLAKIECEGIIYSASRFPTAEQAARWYDSMARSLFGEFAALNFPNDPVADKVPA